MQVWDEMQEAFEFDRQEEIRHFGFSTPPLSYKLRRWIPLYISIALCLLLLVLIPDDGSGSRSFLLIYLVAALVMLVVCVLVPAVQYYRELSGVRKLQRRMQQGCYKKDV